MYIEECLCVEINVSVDMESIYQIVSKLTVRSGPVALIIILNDNH